MNPNFILLKFKINYKMPIFVQVNYDKSLIVFFMNIDLLLRSVDLKYDFTPFLRILSQIGLPTGQGWVRTKRKLEQKFHDDPKSLEKFKKLNRTYQECVITGNKTSSFFKVSDSSYYNDVYRFFESLSVPQNDYSNYYPYVMPVNELQKNHVNVYKIANIDNDIHGITVVLCNHRIHEDKNTIETGSLRGQAKKEFNQYDRLIAIKDKPIQTFDILFLHKKRQIIELRLDWSQTIKIRPEQVLKSLKGFITNLNPSLLKFKVFEEKLPLNPLYNAFYKNRDGILVELGFATDDAFDRHTYNRRAKEDIRDTQFHNNAAANAKIIEPFKVEVKMDV
jgi:hypothetical protein